MKRDVIERLQKLRKELKLSQEFVAKQLGISRSAVSLIETGQRDISAKELELFAKIYGVTMDQIMNGVKQEKNVVAFARAFNQLTEQDQDEIMSLMQFKNRKKRELINA